MSERSDAAATDIAIIGMAVRVPGANTIDQFWRNLRTGVKSIRLLTHEELLAAGESLAKLSDKNYVARTAELSGMELFDADFFGFGRQEAAIMDPQHRQFLIAHGRQSRFCTSAQILERTGWRIRRLRNGQLFLFQRLQPSEASRSSRDVSSTPHR